MPDTDLARLRIGDILDRQVERNGDRDCVVYPAQGVRFTYKQFRDRVDIAARGLMALGVRKSEHVAIMAPNIPEWSIVQFAAARIGAVLVPLNTQYRARELEAALRNSETTTLFLAPAADSPDPFATLREVVPELDEAPVGHARFEKLPRLGRLISIGKRRQPAMLRFDDLFDLSVQSHPQDYARRGEALDSFDVIMLLYTSGTTDTPKGVMLAHRNCVVTAWYMAERLDVGEDERICAAVPFYHCMSSIGASLAGALRGACVVPVETFNPRTVLEVVQSERCTLLSAMPYMLAAMLDEPKLDSYDRSSLRKGVTGGTPVPVPLAKAATEKLGIPALTIGYGLTEATAAVTRTAPGEPPERRLGTVGRALASVQLKVVGADGERVAAGTSGELCCRGLGLMKGYFRDPEGTAEAIDPEGWLHTKDLATIDADGYVNIVGRLRDMIVRSGEKIYPREVEVLLATHPKVAEVHVIGVPLRGVGEDVCACVVLKSDTTLDEAEVHEFCRGQLRDSKIPTLVMTLQSFPLSAGGKILKRELRKMAIERFGRQADAAEPTA